MNDHPRHFSFPSLPLVSRVLDLVCVVTPLVKLVRWLRVPKIYASRSISSSKHINQDYEFYSIIFRFLNNPPFVSKTNSRSEFWRILISPWLEKKKENNLHRHPTVPFLLLPLLTAPLIDASGKETGFANGKAANETFLSLKKHFPRKP